MPTRLAALSYRTGRYDLAAKLAAESSSPLAEWVKAKIALQKGDLAAAAAHYAAASKGFPEARDTNQLDSDNANLVVGETGRCRGLRAANMSMRSTSFIPLPRLIGATSPISRSGC